MADPKLLLLALLAVGDNRQIEGITRFQKLVFLAQQEIEGLDVDKYHFDSHKYGPFSEDLYDDLDALVAAEYVDREIRTTRNGNDKQVYSLTEQGEQFMKDVLSDGEVESDLQATRLSDMKGEYNDMPMLELIRRIDEDYPKYTSESELNL